MLVKSGFFLRFCMKHGQSFELLTDMFRKRMVGILHHVLPQVTNNAAAAASIAILLVLRPRPQTGLATLDRRQAPELCQSLSQIYTFVCARLITASVQRSAQAAAEAERVFAPVAAGFLRVLGAASASAR